MSLETRVEITPFKDRMLITSILVASLHAVFGGFPINYLISLPYNGKSIVGRYALAAKAVAEEDIASQRLIPPDFPLRSIIVDDRCSGTSTLKAVLESWYNATNDGTVPANTKPDDFVLLAVGGTCSVSCRPLANYFAAFSVSFISSGCITKELSDNDVNVGYPTSARVVGHWQIMKSALAKFVEAMKWKRLGFIMGQSDSDWLQFQETLKNSLISRRLDIKFESHTVSMPTSSINISEKAIEGAQVALERMRGKTMVIVLLVYDTAVLCTLLAANRLGMLKNYIYITVSYNRDLGSNRWPNVTEIKYVQQGLVSLNFMRPGGAIWDQFRQRVADAVPRVRDELKSNPDKLITVEPPGKQLHLAAGLLYDAIMMWANAAKVADVFPRAEPTAKTLTIERRMEVVHGMFNLRFQGVTGEVVTDFVGDRILTLGVDILQDETFVGLGTYNYQSSVFDLHSDQLGKTIWPGGRRGVPPGYPEPCGYDDEFCPEPIYKSIAFQIGMACLAFFLLLAAIIPIWYFCYYKKSKSQAEIYAIISWIVNCDEVLTDFDGRSMTGLKRVSSSVRRVSAASTQTKTQTFTMVGYYRGTVVCIKPIDREGIERTDPLLFSELKEMRSIKHENLNGFIGVCILAPNVSCLTVYCKNGSLQDIIQDDQFELGDEFKISFTVDIAQGMSYLHSSVLQSHGHLSSSNCVIDSKWACKITDYGMGNFKQPTKPPEKNDKYYTSLFWTAPELLRMREDHRPMYGTQMGDVYSYGIILQELALRDFPYTRAKLLYSNDEIILKVREGSTPPFRPKVSDNACSPEWMLLMTTCWSETPEARPKFDEVLKRAQMLNGGQPINIVDNMLKKLEVHNRKLEKLVADRTAELNVEKKKVESLLYNILPRTVAESLMRQGRVTPEAFDSATVYFSDIVGFMKINQSSTAYQVVALLNGIYSVFDAVTDTYDVYKCETIGDVYMVASGLPIRNGDRHAAEIATMAMHLLSTVTTFKIPHMPDKMLQLRCGMHSGSVVAGVVGLKMPHYCLFGDTVNTASRMQSGGLALRIHCSNTSAALLERNGNFELECRGEREVKGKGLMKTYWVLSKKDFDLPMPDLSLAATLEEHEFK